MMDNCIFSILLTISILALALEGFQTIQPALFTKVWECPDTLGQPAWERVQMSQGAT